MISEERVSRSNSRLWADYLFLSKEMVKFLDEEDFDLFMELMEQREQLQQIIEATPEEGFLSSSEGQIVFANISQLNRTIMNKLHYTHNNSQKLQGISQAYDGFSRTSIGVRMDRQT